MNFSFVLAGTLAWSTAVGGDVGGFGDLPASQHIIDRSVLGSAATSKALRAAETRHAVTCQNLAPGRPEMVFLWTMQWASADCPFVEDPGRGVRVRFRYVQKLNGEVALRRTRVRAAVFSR